jgi:uncharacterized phiE125 gp8 family phage protein
MVKPLSYHHTLELVDAPVNKPISLKEVKEQLRIEHPDDDVLITRLINVAVAYTDVKGALGHAMITQKWGQWISANPTQQVELFLGPVQSVTAVKYYDTDGVLQDDDVNNYDVFGTEHRIIVSPKSGFSWPTAQQRDDAIKIEYQVGFGDTAASVPETLRHALMLLIGHWYDNREQTQMDQLQDIPFGFMELMNMHKAHWYG